MLQKRRIAIEGKGPFQVCFGPEGAERWPLGTIRFYEAEELIGFLVDTMFVPPQEASQAVLDALARGRSVVGEN